MIPSGVPFPARHNPAGGPDTMSRQHSSHPRLARIAELARREVTDAERTAALEFCTHNRVALFIVAYNAERHLASVVDRIPPEFLGRLS